MKIRRRKKGQHINNKSDGISGRKALIGKYFHTVEGAVGYYNEMSEVLRKHQSIVEFKSGECMIVGNESIKALDK